MATKQTRRLWGRRKFSRGVAVPFSPWHEVLTFTDDGGIPRTLTACGRAIPGNVSLTNREPGGRVDQRLCAHCRKSP